MTSGSFSRTANRTARLHLAAVAALVLVGAGLRLHNLGDKSLWLDESHTWTFVESSWQNGLHMLLQAIVYVPLYHATLRLVVPLVGLSEFSLRQTSVWASLLALPVFYRVGCALFDRRVGLLAAGLLTVSPFAVWYAQDARAYSLYLLTAGLVLWGLWRAIAGKGWGLFTGGSLALYLTHFVGGMFAYVQAMYLLTALRRRRGLVRRWALAQAVAVLPLAGWMIAILILRRPLASPAWIPPTDLFDPILALWNYVSGDADRWTAATLTAPLFLALFALGVRRTRPPVRALLLWWLLLPMTITWVAGVRIFAFVDRYFIPELLALYLFLAAGAASLPRRWGMTAGAAAASAMLLFTLRIYSDPYFAKEDWRSAAAYLRASDSTIVVAAAEPVIALVPYMRDDLGDRLALATQPEEIMRYAQAGPVDLVFLSSLDSKHRLSKSLPFDPLKDGPPAFLQWRAAHPATPLVVHAYTGLAIVSVAP